MCLKLLTTYILIEALSVSISSSAAGEVSDNDANDRRRLINWGRTFSGVKSENVDMNCTWGGKPVCCDALAPRVGGIGIGPDDRTRGIGNSLLRDNFSSSQVFQSSRQSKHKFGCSFNRSYISSPYEVRQLAKAKEIADAHRDENIRRKILLAHLVKAEEVSSSLVWLQRVKEHMSSPRIPTITDDDREYLSKYVITKKCSDGSERSWEEWIEPISIHMRHPFAMRGCDRQAENEDVTAAYGNVTANGTKVHVLSSDYVLLQSPISIYNNSNINFGQLSGKPTKHYFFDAGTSSFSSSMSWFTCAYSQRNMSFDQIYGWEYTLLEPRAFWQEVPPNWKPFYHFFNNPITASPTDPDSPLRFISTVATRDDFVSFKLDVDRPNLEIPIAMEIANNPVFTELIDEFFLEVHFNCEIMKKCGWGKRIPFDQNGLILSRPNVMNFFLKLRNLGIRAHVWP